MRKRFFGCLAVIAVAAVACTGAERSPALTGGPPANAGTTCVDKDNDGYGEGCELGRDCDDQDADVANECFRCAHPEQGCPCERGRQPIACFLEPTELDDGQVECHEGTRYCRDGEWTGCESVHSYLVSPGTNPGNAIIDPDAGVASCDVCYVNCYRTNDPLVPVDGGLDDSSCDGPVTWADGGGITLAPNDAGQEGGDAGVADAGHVEEGECTPGFAPDMDCDGIPDEFDPYPEEEHEPFQTDNPAIFLQLGPGQTGSGTVDVEFMLNNADVYFLLDQTGSMEDERINLHAGLTSGSYLGEDVQCADYDFDGVPNNELRDQGIIGAIRCLIRDAWFGAGFHRELPFYGSYGYGNSDEVIFRHFQDLTGDVSAVQDAINSMGNNGNIDWPEGHTQALWSIATGNGLYLGYNRPGVPPRDDCPEGTWGYPCFREGTIPIIILFTDAMFHNGPPPGYEYPETFTITAGTTAQYISVSPDNETFASAYDAGDVTDSFVTYVGNTGVMEANLPGSVVSCGADDDANDAVFRFELSSGTTITMETSGSSYDTVMSLHSGIPVLPPDPVAVSGNETHVSAYDAGDIYDNWFIGTGDTVSMDWDYQGSVIGCDAKTYANEAVYGFTLSQDSDVTVSTGGSGFDTVLSLHDGPIPLRPTPVAVSNTNDTHETAHDAGEMYGQYKVFTGDTSSVGIGATYDESIVGCGAHTDADDAVYAFTLSQATRVRIDTEDTGHDTVISLHDGPMAMPSITVADGANEDVSSALDVGDVVGRWVRVQGDTTAMDDDLSGDFVGCGAHTNAADAVVAFSLSQETTVQIDTEDSCFDTVESLHTFGSGYDSVVDITIPANAGNENHLTAYELGDLYRAYWDFQGGSGAPADSDYLGGIIGCGAGDESPDIAFSFSLSQGTHVRIDASSTPFDSVIAIHDGDIPITSPTQVDNSNEDEASAYEVGSIDGQILAFTGNSQGMDADYEGSDIGCSAHDDARDAVYQFTLDAATEVQIDTEGSGFDTVIALFEDSIEGGGSALECDNDSGSDSTSRITRNLDAGTYYVVVKGDNSNSRGPYRITFRDVTNPPETNQIVCENGPGRDAVIEQWLDAGDYYLILKAAEGDSGANYKIVMQDLDAAGSRIDCDNDSGPGSTSLMTHTLPAGDYYVVVKGDGSGDDGCYNLNIRDVNSGDANRIACDNDSGPGSTSVIEQELDAGDYFVVVKGDHSSDEGDYVLTMRDVTHHPDNRIACNNDFSGSTSQITASLSAGTYYAVVKGDTSSSEGDYRISILGADNTDDKRIECDDDDGVGYASKIVRYLNPGDYYVVVKGYDDDDEGPYQLTIGTGSTQSSTFTPITWPETLSALQDNGIKLMTVLSCHDDYWHGDDDGDCNVTRSQAQQIAELTGAMADRGGPQPEPLVMDIDSDGTGLSVSVVEAVQDLADYVSMDVSVQVVFDPDPNPGFVIGVEAVDRGPGDGCQPPVGVEHQNCLPGAVPEFSVTFTNPHHPSVQPNPARDDGSYWFMVQLIGDGQYVLDTVPVYIIPEPPPPSSDTYSSASYWQDIAAPQCGGNERPDWSDMYWVADMPNGTRLEFSACAADTDAELESCVFGQVATVTASGTCNGDADCDNGTCADNYVCRFITAGSCSSDDDCAAAATCIDSTCTYAEQPADVATAVGADNYLNYLRMRVTLYPDDSGHYAPTLTDWSVAYVCTSTE